MRKVIYLLAFGLFLSLPIRASRTIDQAVKSSVQEENQQTKMSVVLSGKIPHDRYVRGAKASCEFMKIPESYEEFVEMYKIAAREPQGAAAMLILALDLYRKDENTGKKCMDYCIYESHPSSPRKIPEYQMRTIRDKLLGDDSYAQPYISTAFYEGATPANKYTPEKYKINFYVKTNDQYAPLSSAQSYVIPLKVRAYGVDWNKNPNRDHNIEVVRPAGEECYYVFRFMDIFMSVLPPNR